MPKVIENLKDNYLNTGRKILMEKGYKAMTLRMVAAECNVALGTIYNYFRSKDELVASIMFIDWKNLLEETKEKCLKEEDEMQGITLIYEMIREFSRSYAFVFTQSSHSAISFERHMMLVKQTSGLVMTVLRDKDEEVAEFVAELLINYGVREKDEYPKIRKYLVRLID